MPGLPALATGKGRQSRPADEPLRPLPRLPRLFNLEDPDALLRHVLPSAVGVANRAAAGDDLVVGGQRDAENGSLPLELRQLFSRRQIPQTQRTVVAAGDKVLATVHELDSLHAIGMTAERLQEFSRRHVPDANVVVVVADVILAERGSFNRSARSRGDAFAVGRERDTPDPAFVFQRAHFFPLGDVPDSGRLVGGSRNEPRAVWAKAEQAAAFVSPEAKDLLSLFLIDEGHVAACLEQGDPLPVGRIGDAESKPVSVEPVEQVPPRELDEEDPIARRE